MWCIPKHLVAEFTARLKSGEITPEKMLAMNSAERRAYFATFLGDLNAQKVNVEFEKKMLLKAQQEGITNWAKQMAGMGKKSQRDMLSRVEKMDTLLNEKDQDAFVADLVAHKLEATVTMEEAANLSSLAKEAMAQRPAAEAANKSWMDRVSAEKKAAEAEGRALDQTKIRETKEELLARMTYGMARVRFDDYYNELKDASGKKLVEYINPKNWSEGVVNVAGFAKSVIASFDDSVVGRQGFKTMATNPDIWMKNSAKSIEDLIKVIVGGDKKLMQVIRAEILSRPNALNGSYRKYGVDVGVREEAYPVSFPERIPVLGRFFKGSEVAFTAWQYRTRADLFDRFYPLMEETGGNSEGLGQLVNAMTGRSGLGRAEAIAGHLNVLMFSARFLMSNLHTLSAHIFDKKLAGSPMDALPWSKTASPKGIAAKNLLLIVTTVAGILAVAKALDPNSVETDPRSSDFGKIRIKNTRFDVTGGLASIVVLAARMITQESKNANTKIVTKLNSDKLGSKSRWDVLLSFIEGKASPVGRAILDHMKGKNFKGEKPGLVNTTTGLFVPIPAANWEELKNDPNAAPIFWTMLLDGLGFGQNTYGTEVDWKIDTSDKMAEFKASVSAQDFDRANKEFNNQFADWLADRNRDSEYKELPDEDKLTVISRKKTQLEKEVMGMYGFKYKPEKKKLPKF